MFDAFTAHAHYVNRYESGLVDDVLRLMRNAEREMYFYLMESPNATINNKQRALDHVKQLNEIEKKYSKEYTETTISDLKTFGAYEADFSIRVLDKAIGDSGINIFTNRINENQILGAATKTPMYFPQTGEVMDFIPAIEGMEAKRLKVISDGVRSQYILGKTNKQIASDLFGNIKDDYTKAAGTIKQARNYTNFTVRTATAHMSTTSRREVFKGNDDVIKGYYLSAVLDNRTSPFCQDIDGKYWIFETPEQSTLQNEEYPPFHRLCRTQMNYLLKDWRELGFDADELTGAQKSSLNGYVPKEMTYFDWLERQSKDIKIDVLGKRRYELWESGAVKIDQFMGSDGKYIKLKELQEMDSKLTTKEKK